MVSRHDVTVEAKSDHEQESPRLGTSYVNPYRPARHNHGS
jgi:hypothetical protein